ncbi:unnamed protein product [Arabidopsis lyrata]|uniref:Kelch repeat-containing F-box family protein n=1 Tax=Arabidopsis lyrata subsp. lyrata TaxID=81972 RepID=D7KFK9_ARALL|nr:hypothetical protein ARALYDRAFT_890603 [Arabidopsis lyrata subsp. lyrata]CAH8253992.1 unnamed protein product [Arabidopsis lyrata]
MPREVPNMKLKRINAFACLIDDKIYVMGGCTTCYGNSSWFEMFDITSQTWRNLPMIPDINISLAYDWRIDAVEGKIYVPVDCLLETLLVDCFQFAFCTYRLEKNR